MMVGARGVKAVGGVAVFVGQERFVGGPVPLVRW